MVTYRLCLPIFTKVFRFNKFLNSLDSDAFLPCESANSPFVDKYWNIVDKSIEKMSQRQKCTFQENGPGSEKTCYFHISWLPFTILLLKWKPFN